MQEAEAWTRPLQNHLPLVRHRTTDAGEWMPQYLQMFAKGPNHNVSQSLQTTAVDAASDAAWAASPHVASVLHENGTLPSSDFDRLLGFAGWLHVDSQTI
jgi:hypothetical protein